MVVNSSMTETDGSDVAGKGGAVLWKMVWMAFMVCCAVRQLLGCIQVRKKHTQTNNQLANLTTRYVVYTCSLSSVHLRI